MPLSNSDFQAIKDIQAKSVKNYSECQLVLNIIKDCRQLSSGTMATLTGNTKYAEIDIIRADLVDFASAVGPKRNWESWQDAWEEFKKIILDCKET